MGTKNDPGLYDCYKKLADDEPFFVLRAKDPSAPFLVEAWAALRAGDFDRLDEIFDAVSSNTAIAALISNSNPKVDEAQTCADSMREWRGVKIAREGRQ